MTLPPLTLAVLADLPADLWLDVTCSCPGHRPISLPISGLAARAGPQAGLAAVVARLRCVSCHGRPVRVVLADQPAYPPGGRHAPAATLAVVLRGEGAAI